MNDEDRPMQTIQSWTSVSEVIIADLDKLEGGVLYLLVRVIEMEVEQIKDLCLVHLAPADLVVLQLVSAKTRLNYNEKFFKICRFEFLQRL